MKKISIFGLGNIGRAFLKEATRNRNLVKNILVRKIKKYDILCIKNIIFKNVFITNIYKKIFFKKIIVELIGGKKIYNIIESILNKKKTKLFITANKNLVSKNYKDIVNFSLKNNMYFGFEASVGGGIPLIKNLFYISHIKFYKIFTVINGTTNYILTCLFKKGFDKKTSCLIARFKGYAEKDISFDLKGIDIAYKLIIIISIVYNCYLKKKNITIIKLNIPINEIINTLIKQNLTIKYVGIIFKKKRIICASIFPILIKEKSIYNVKYEYNFILLKSKKFGKLFLKSKGAGKCPTSSSVFSDLKSKLIVHYPKKKLFFSDRILKNKIAFILKKKKFFFFLFLNNLKIKKVVEIDGFIFIKTLNIIDNKRIFFLNKISNFKESIFRIK